MARVRDISGTRFGMLVAIKPTARRGNGQVMWECLCDCGTTVYVRRGPLTTGRSRSCGCLRYHNLKGMRFGRLVVTRIDKERKNNSVSWECLCDCGCIVHVLAGNLKQGLTKSCGCLHSEMTIAANRSRKKETSEKNKYKRNFTEYKEWRKAVYNRDNYTCQKCGRRASHKLNAHHIESYANNEDLRTVLSNGVTLCKDCHDNFHHLYGRGNNTREHLNKFMGQN